MAVANNADDYTVGRVGYFFTANNETPNDGNLTGQCVTLIKWFLAQMTSVPNPFGARGDARYVGKRLVAEGQAVEVPYSQRRRGDIITMEYGVYGHIYVQLSGGQVFEENVNWPGVASKIVDGDRVFASRIGSEAEAWRHDIHVYRINSYNEKGANMPSVTTLDEARIIAYGVGGRNGVKIDGDTVVLDNTQNALGGYSDGDLNAAHVGQVLDDDLRGWYNSDEGQSWRNGRLNQLISIAQQVVPLKQQLALAQTTEQQALEAKAKAEAELKKLQDQATGDQATGNSFLRWLGNQLNKLTGSK